MRRRFLILLGFLPGILFFVSGPVKAQQRATPQEVYDMVLKAALMIEQLGTEGLTALSETREFIWKDSYVWAVDCGRDVVVAHPNRKVIGLKLATGWDKNPDKSKRKQHNLEMCKGAANPAGIWVEYWWEKLGDNKASRKISFMVQVPGQPYQVTAGIYDDSTSVVKLNQSLK